MNPFIDDHQDTCILEESAALQTNGPIAYLTMDLKNQRYTLNNSFLLLFHPIVHRKQGRIIFFLLLLDVFFSVTVSCSKDWHNIHIYKDREILRTVLLRRPDTNDSPRLLLENQRKRRSGTLRT